ncbi:MAG TPA: hypothetical protein VN328_12480, partial [Thermodesulfovibrionales bacterium]|nr:hypothetical protein [Thermodesulfovibrionales bacterium]
IESGGRVREHLRDGVEEALKIFGNGFLAHPDNKDLRQQIRDGRLDAADYYRQLLRIIYRFLFLMVSEERNLVGPDPENDHLRKVYTWHYSISRLREKVERPVNMEERYWDLWEGVKQAFRLYSHEHFGQKMGVAPLNGDLFGPHAMPQLENAFLYNRDFLRGFAHLSIFKENRTFRRINYAHLDVEELGSVYESLLDYHPVVKENDGAWSFELAFGTERKSTGSYYTRSELVQELIKSALVPVIEERLKNAKTPQEKEQALLSLKVCDTSTGSGHFLLAAARRIGRELAKVRSGEDEPTPTEFRKAVRDVIEHCIYGVDLNPLAVDLCKVALWLEGHNRGYPLTFLDHRIKCGNSLIGLDKMDRLKDGIPDDAFKPVTGDDKEVAKQIKAINKKERKDREKGQELLPFDIAKTLDSDLTAFAEQARTIDAISDNSPEDVHKKQENYQRIRADQAWFKDWTAANIWTAAFFYPLTRADDPAIPTHERLLRFIENPKAAHGQLVGKANALAAKHRFFHWPLEFPEIAKAGGFDVVLGNPPWERIKLQEQEFFAVRDSEIATAPNKAARTRLINKLVETNPGLLKEFEDSKHAAEADSRFVSESCRFVLSAVGDINTYALFSELSRRLLNSRGKTGIIVPTGIATDDTCKQFFSDLSNCNALISLYDFENREALFPGVHRSYKFCLLTMAISRDRTAARSEFVFFLGNTEEIKNEDKRLIISVDDIKLINPKTETCPVFRTRHDYEIALNVYRKAEFFDDTLKNTKNIPIEIGLRVDNSKESKYFVETSEEQEPDLSPFYEGKMIEQFNHRYSSFNGTDFIQSRDPDLRNPAYSVQPKYFIREAIAKVRYKQYSDWYIGIRRLARSTDERTIIACILPKSCPAYSFNTFKIDDYKHVLFYLGALNSIALDYQARQKLGGANVTWSFAKQIPLPGYDSTLEYLPDLLEAVLELTYVACDLSQFAMFCNYDGPPFTWDEDRRMMLKAELDAYYAMLYGLTRDELRYILDPQDVYGPKFPGETFRVLKEKEIKQYGEYRTRRLVLEAWDRLFGEK